VQLLVAPRLAGLALQGDDLPLDLAQDVGQAQQVLLGLVQLADGLALVGLVLGDAAGFLEHLAAVFGTRAQDAVDAALLHQRVGVGADAGVHEQALDVLQAAGRLVDEVLAFPGAEHAAGHGDLVEAQGQRRLAIGQRHADLGHAERLGGVGAVEDHVLHLGPAHGLGALFAQDPADGVRDVALAAAVGPDNRSHPGLEF
jgi:hypothetical protein